MPTQHLWALIIPLSITLVSHACPIKETKWLKSSKDVQTVEKSTAEASNAPSVSKVSLMQIDTARKKIIESLHQTQKQIKKLTKPTYHDVRQVGYEKCLAHWDSGNCQAFIELVNRESGWKVGIRNRHSGAAGLGQALPASKMGPGCLGNFDCELNWTINYVKGRYTIPYIALQHHDIFGWY